MSLLLWVLVFLLFVLLFSIGNCTSIMHRMTCGWVLVIIIVDHHPIYYTTISMIQSTTAL